MTRFVERNERHERREKPLAAARDLLPQREPCPGHHLDPRLDGQLVVEMRGMQVIGLQIPHSKDDPLLRLEPHLIHAPRPQGIAAGDPVSIAIRPERLKIGAEGFDNTVTGTVVATAYQGLDLQLHLKTDLAAQPILVRLTAQDVDDTPLSEGSTLSIGWAAKDTRVFKA